MGMHQRDPRFGLAMVIASEIRSHLRRASRITPVDRGAQSCGPKDEARAVAAAPGFWEHTTGSRCDCAPRYSVLRSAERASRNSAAEHRQVSSAFATDTAFRLERKRLMGLGVGLYRTDARDAQVKFFVSFRKRIKRCDRLAAAVDLAEKMLMEHAQ